MNAYLINFLKDVLWNTPSHDPFGSGTVSTDSLESTCVEEARICSAFNAV